jgi:hypothetical protein
MPSEGLLHFMVTSIERGPSYHLLKYGLTLISADSCYFSFFTLSYPKVSHLDFFFLNRHWSDVFYTNCILYKFVICF